MALSVGFDVSFDNTVASKMGGYTSSVSGQRLGIHVPAATNRRATMEGLLERGCFCVVRAEMLQARDKVRT
jgi:hypothetical protein